MKEWAKIATVDTNTHRYASKNGASAADDLAFFRLASLPEEYSLEGAWFLMRTSTSTPPQVNGFPS